MALRGLTIGSLTLYSLRKEIGTGPFGPLFVKFLLFILGKKNLNQNDVEFDFSIGHALVLFPFFD